MAERRGDDSVAPRRTLTGSSKSDGSAPSGDAGADRSMAQRVSSAVAAAGSAVQSAASPGGGATARDKPADKSGGMAANRSGAKPTGQPSDKPVRATTTRRGSRRARLRLVHLDPWSVMKTAFLLSIALGIVTVVAVTVVWSVLGAAGVWESINQTVADVLGNDSAQNFDVENYVGLTRVLGFTMIVSVFNVVLITAIATLGAFLYNLSAALLGGIEVTLAEDDR